MSCRGAACILASVVVCLALGCRTEPPAEKAAVRDPVLEERALKDEAFRNDPGSPLSEQYKAAFRGLAYYPLNPQLRFRVKLNRYERPETVRIGTKHRRDPHRAAVRVLRIRNRRTVLPSAGFPDAGQPSPGPPHLFIPFRDATSGKETYGAGRYIDLRENTSGVYDLDFNSAYNPSCAYGREDFSCPVPPAQNTLPVAVMAGEKKYSPGENH